MITGGNPGMATAGMGDLLTGVISSFLVNLEQMMQKVISVAAHIHSKAGIWGLKMVKED